MQGWPVTKYTNKVHKDDIKVKVNRITTSFHTYWSMQLKRQWDKTLYIFLYLYIIHTLFVCCPYVFCLFVCLFVGLLICCFCTFWMMSCLQSDAKRALLPNLTFQLPWSNIYRGPKFTYQQATRWQWKCACKLKCSMHASCSWLCIST